MCRLLQFFLKLFQLFFILFVFVEISRHDSLKGKGSSLPDLIAIGFEFFGLGIVNPPSEGSCKSRQQRSQELPS